MNMQDYGIQYRKWHTAYERRSYKIFRKALLATARRVPVDNLSYYNYKQVIPLNIEKKLIEQAYFDVYTQIGLIHGNRVGRGINKDLKDYSAPLFNEEFQKTIIDWVRVNCGANIISVSDTLADAIIKLVEQSLAKNLTLDEMQRFIRRSLDNGSAISRYEVLRIARTETGAAANHSALVSGQTSGIVLEKVWISTISPRTRVKPKDEYDHIAMNGATVEQDQPFTVTSRNGVVDRIDFPCDPKGRPANIIQCRCAVALRPKRDSQGLVIRR